MNYFYILYMLYEFYIRISIVYTLNLKLDKMYFNISVPLDILIQVNKKRILDSRWLFILIIPNCWV